jgi:hypothetical protein
LDRIHAGSKNNIILNEWNNYLFCWEDNKLESVITQFWVIPQNSLFLNENKKIIKKNKIKIKAGNVEKADQEK